VDAIPGTLDVIAMGGVIPFFGMLIGLTSIGHSVWIFDGQPAALEAGSRDADLLIVDSARGATITTKSLDQAAEAMRNANILIHDRSSGQLRAFRLVGKERVEFRARELQFTFVMVASTSNLRMVTGSSMAATSVGFPGVSTALIDTRSWAMVGVGGVIAVPLSG
jgi:hypothetical protein